MNEVYIGGLLFIAVIQSYFLAKHREEIDDIKKQLEEMKERKP